MFYLILSILCSTAISLVFKSFNNFKDVKLFHAIVVNYWVCALLGTAALGKSPITATTVQEPWFIGAVLLGIFFICTFYIIGLTVAVFGAAISAVTQRMSLVIPVLFAFLYYSEAATTFKILGIILALVAVYLTNYKSKSEKEIAKTAAENNSVSKNRLLLLLPIILFLVSGVVEAFLQYLQRTYFDASNDAQLPFTVLLFGTAGIMGIIPLIFQYIRRGETLNYQSILGGITLGIPNLGSIYFLLKVLGEMQGSVVFPINNVAIIVLVGVVAYFLFKEKLSTINIIGIGLAVLSIIFIGILG